MGEREYLITTSAPVIPRERLSEVARALRARGWSFLGVSAVSGVWRAYRPADQRGVVLEAGTAHDLLSLVRSMTPASLRQDPAAQ